MLPRQIVLVCVVVLHRIGASRGHISANHHSEEDHEAANKTTSMPVSDHRFFLHEIFTKYGHNGQMTFEGFEHLLESLGLGNILISDHDLGSHRESLFQDSHATHHHPRLHDPRTDGPDSTSLTAAESTNKKPTFRNQNELSTLRDLSKVETNDKISTSVKPRDSSQTTTESVFHYSLREDKIPELLTNISTLVEQHQEIENISPQIIIDQCLTPREILNTFGINQTSNLSPVSFLHLCPAIIYELDQGHCLMPHRSNPIKKEFSTLHQWLYATSAVAIISICGLLSVAMVPVVTKWFYQTLMQFLVGLAVGSLSGDALLHLLPHAMLGGNSSHDHEGLDEGNVQEKVAVFRGLVALGSVLFFFVAERLLGSYADYRRRKKPDKMQISASGAIQNGQPRDSIPHLKTYDNVDPTEKEIISMLNAEGCISRKNSVESLSGLELNLKNTNHSVQPMGSTNSKGNCEIEVERHGHCHSHDVPNSVNAVAMMVILGDGLHNFCDGLAIGAAFASGVEGGISTAIAVFCHELPHELGDFAMLLKTGIKVKQALLYNVLSSILCLTGMAIGVSLGNVHSATSWIFAATAGMFLYIALVDMLPELSSGSNNSSASTLYQLGVQVLGISCGVSIMLLIAAYEQELKSIVS